MASQELPDFDGLLRELGCLLSEEVELSAVRKRLHDRIFDAGYANEVTTKRERQISDERRALHERIAALRAQLAPVLRTHP